MDDGILELPLLPVAARGTNSVEWWGLLCLIATESALFGYLLFSYLYVAVQRGRAWLPEPHPSLLLAGPNTLVLLSSSVAVWWAEQGVKHGRRGQQLLGLALSIVLGAAFAGVQTVEWAAKPFRPWTGSYGSLFFTVTGFHMAHVLAGLGLLSVVLVWSALGYFSPRRHAAISMAALYWHFVDAVWIAVFSTFYLSPYVTA